MAARERDLRLRPAHFRQVELARMDRVNRPFRLPEAVDLALLLGGVTMGGVGGLSGQDTVSGVGPGIGLHSAALLCFDFFAGQRALRGTGSLSRFRP